jgi:hypothetical protein
MAAEAVRFGCFDVPSYQATTDGFAPTGHASQVCQPFKKEKFDADCQLETQQGMGLASGRDGRFWQRIDAMGNLPNSGG